MRKPVKGLHICYCPDCGSSWWEDSRDIQSPSSILCDNAYCDTPDVDVVLSLTQEQLEEALEKVKARK